jgi:hypothetical protein
MNLWKPGWSGTRTVAPSLHLASKPKPSPDPLRQADNPRRHSIASVEGRPRLVLHRDLVVDLEPAVQKSCGVSVTAESGSRSFQASKEA